MVPLPGAELDRASRDFLAEHPPGGVVLFRRNIRSAAQLRALTGAIHETGAAIGARDDARLVEAVGRAMGRELRAAGIDLDFAPVLDVWSNPRNRVIGDR